MSNEVSLYLFTTLPELNAAAARWLSQNEDPGVLELLRALDQSDIVQRVEAVWEMYRRRAVAPLIVALHDTSPRGVGPLAARQLGVLGDARAVEPLIASLQGSNSAVLGEAAYALGRLGDRRAIEPLAGLLRHNALSDEVGVRAIEALRCLGAIRWSTSCCTSFSR